VKEKELIVGKVSSKTRLRILIIGVAIFALGLIMYLCNVGGVRIYHSLSHTIHSSLFEAMLFTFVPGLPTAFALDMGLLLTIVGAIIYFSLSRIAITVTDKRVYGNTTWGKRVDLPLDSISAVSLSALKGVAVATSSGRIVFKGIENYKEVHQTISDLLIDRQNNRITSTLATITQEIPQSNADELAKYKELLDKDIITKEEFDAKKKQLLGL